MKVGDALAPGHHRQPQQLHPGTVGRRGGQRQLEGVDVPQRVVVVVLNVVDGLGGLAGVAGGLVAVGDLGPGSGLAGVGDEAHAGQAAGQAQAYQIGGSHRRLSPHRGEWPVAARGLGGRLCGQHRLVRIVHQAVEPALPQRQIARPVACAAAAQGIAQPVIEAADAAAVERTLRRLHKARAVGHFAEIPALADEGNLAPVVRTQQGLHALHHGARLMPHQIEPKRVDAVLTRPQAHRVEHQLGHHAVLGGAVVAAGAALDLAGRIEPVVVAGHDAVEHGSRVLARRRQMVVNHVHAHPQPGAVQAHHHLAKLQDARCPVVGPAGIAAFGRIEVQRVIAPVETITRSARHHGRLLSRTVGRGLGDHRCAATALGHRGKVEHRQQMNIGQARFGQCRQVAHAGTVSLGESGVLAPRSRGHAGIEHRKIAHMQLIHRQVGGAGQCARRGLAGPARWGERRRIEATDPGPVRVHAQADGVGVGHALAHQALAWHPDIDQVAVEAAGPITGQRGLPDAAAVIALQGRYGADGGVVIGIQAQADTLRGGRPERKAGGRLRTAGVAAQRGHWRQHAQDCAVSGRVQIVQRARVL